MRGSLQVENFFISGLIFTEQLFLYSMGARLIFTQDQEHKETCVIVFIGYIYEAESFVLVSEPLK